MNPPPDIRRTLPHELADVNAWYAQVDFKPSSAHDFVALARIDGVAAGLGRVVATGDDTAELGGMLVFPAFRGHGLSKAIIDFLIHSTDFNVLYCLPFAELEALYQSAGFVRVPANAAVPPPVLEKHQWCKQFYPKPVLLMVRER